MELKVTMHFEASFSFMHPPSDDYKMLVSFLCVLEAGNVTLLPPLYFQRIDREEFQKSVGNVCGLQPADLTTAVHILSASHLVICGSMNFDHKSKQFNNMKYSSVQVIQVRAESKALI